MLSDVPRSSSLDLLVLHGVRLLGMARPAGVAARFGLDSEDVAERLLDFEALGWVTHTRFPGSSGWSLTDRGRGHAESLLASELSEAGEQRETASVVRAVHERFVPLNARFQESITRWQLRPIPGDPLAANDHSDHRWDDRVLAELSSLVRLVLPLCRELAGELARFAEYDVRFADAMKRAQSGQARAVDGLRGEALGGDSLHTVWFELHEDLVATLGITR